MLYHDAFDPSLSLTARYQEFPFFEAIRAEDGLKKFFGEVAKRAQLEADNSRSATPRALRCIHADGSKRGRFRAIAHRRRAHDQNSD